MLGVTSNEEVYADWVFKWRLWRKSWCESNEPVVEFYLQFVCKRGTYNPTDLADLASAIGSSGVGPSRIDKSGVIEVRNGAVVLPTISANGEDRLGIVTLKLSFFSRREILTIALILENLGHGVLHDNGRVVSTCYSNCAKSPRKMPCRDDPVWAIVEDGLLGKKNN